MRHFLIITLALFFVLPLMGQNKSNTSTINWLSIEEAVKKQKEQPKTILVDIYTDWCGWCKKLKKETLEHPSIAAYINAYYYPVRFDAETTDTVQYLDSTFINRGKGRRPTHDLAYYLTKNRPSYPTLVYIDDQFNINPVPGYVDHKKIEPILVFFAERVYKTSDYDHFNKAFTDIYNDTSILKRSGDIQWMSLDSALQAMEQQPRKMFILFHSKYYQKVASRLMQEGVLKHPVIADYINNHFYPVSFPATSTDTVEIMGQVFINEQKQPGYPHQLPIAFLQQNMTFPAIVFLNEDMQLLSPIKGFVPGYIVEPYFQFIGEDLYKDTEWSSFFQNFDGKVK